jgi:hypothetical protein
MPNGKRRVKCLESEEAEIVGKYIFEMILAITYSELLPPEVILILLLAA